MNKTEILQETIDWYSADPANRRAVCNPIPDDADKCVYLHPNTGAKCGFGRVMTDEAIEQYGDFSGGVYALASSIIPASENIDLLPLSSLPYLDPLIKPEYRGHSVGFWAAIQALHDREVNWTGIGLSDSGKQTVRDIITFIETGNYD